MGAKAVSVDCPVQLKFKNNFKLTHGVAQLNAYLTDVDIGAEKWLANYDSFPSNAVSRPRIRREHDIQIPPP